MQHHPPTHARRRRAARILGTSIISFAAFGGLATAVPAVSASPARFAVNGLIPTQTFQSGYSPSQIQSAYDITPLQSAGINGAGETIAFIEIDGFSMKDMTRFDAKYHLPAPQITKTYVGGKPARIADQGESTMDLEWAHALAPAAKLDFLYLRNQSASPTAWKQMATAVNMAVQNGAVSISISLGNCGPTRGYTSTSAALASAVSHGVTTFVSSGDTGARPGTIKQCGRAYGAAYPASDPSVVSVGGTSLNLNADNSIASEGAWNLSGGGSGHPIVRPVWQVAPTLVSGSFREVPDVAWDADPQTGVDMIWKGRDITSGGTSLGAPSWAAVWALLAQNASQSGTTLPAGPATFYRIGTSSAYNQAFHDVTTGDNGLYSAGTGWDAVTGWGTPDVAQLATAIAATQ